MKSKQEQKGMISLIVTLIIVMMIGVIILTFGNFTRREQTQTFERQLSSEAYYAAESGINDAVEIIKEAQESTNPAVRNILERDKDECKKNPPGYPASARQFEYQLDGTDNVQYSCLLLDPTPETVEFSNIDTGQTKVFPVDHANPSNPNNVTSLDVWWHYTEANNPPNFTGCNGISGLPETWPVDTCQAGMLRMDIVPARTSGFTASSLSSSSRTIYIKPNRNNATATYSSAIADGDIKTGNCYETPGLSASKPKYCRIKLAGGLPGSPSDRYYIRLTALYMPATLTLCSSDCVNTNLRYELKEAQAQIDSTGLASGVIHRIQARVNISGLDGPFPSFAIESVQNICKQFSIIPGTPAPGTIEDNATGNCSTGWL